MQEYCDDATNQELHLSNAPINISPHPGQGGEFSLFGMAGLPQGSGYWIAKVRMRNSRSACPIKIWILTLPGGWGNWILIRSNPQLCLTSPGGGVGANIDRCIIQCWISKWIWRHQLISQNLIIVELLWPHIIIIFNTSCFAASSCRWPVTILPCCVTIFSLGFKQHYSLKTKPSVSKTTLSSLKMTSEAAKTRSIIFTIKSYPCVPKAGSHSLQGIPTILDKTCKQIPLFFIYRDIIIFLPSR